jgi:hypothetical protein
MFHPSLYAKDHAENKDAKSSLIATRNITNSEQLLELWKSNPFSNVSNDDWDSIN